MQARRPFTLAVLLGIALLGCKNEPADANKRAKARQPTSLDAKHSALQRQFNRDKAFVRVVVLVSPT